MNTHIIIKAFLYAIDQIIVSNQVSHITWSVVPVVVVIEKFRTKQLFCLQIK